MPNPIEKDLDQTVANAVTGRQLAFTMTEHHATSDKLADLEEQAAELFTALTSRGYKKTGAYLRAILENLRKARGAQNFAFLKERRTAVESPYYGGVKGEPPEEEDADHGDETD